MLKTRHSLIVTYYRDLSCHVSFRNISHLNLNRYIKTPNLQYDVNIVIKFAIIAALVKVDSLIYN